MVVDTTAPTEPRNRTVMGARVVEHTHPGYGAAYKAGLNAASGDVVITMDGDDLSAGTIPKLVDQLLERRWDFLSAPIPVDRSALHAVHEPVRQLGVDRGSRAPVWKTDP